jgi:hypothetical protein
VKAMKRAEADKLVNELRQLMQTIVDRLNSSNDAFSRHWIPWMQTSLDEIQRQDFQGITRFLGAFGGMGSFNEAYPYDIRDAVSNAWDIENQLRNDFEK